MAEAGGCPRGTAPCASPDAFHEESREACGGARPVEAGKFASFSLKSLAHEDALLALEAARFAEEQTGEPLRGQRLLIALSGGADSTALLVLFCALRPMLHLELFAAHLDHGLRQESAEDADAAQELCRALGVPFFRKREDVAALSREWRCGIEDAGRRARRAFLEECRVRCGASRTLTAHHAGDLAEDVLLRLVRGAGWPALGGMKAVSDEPGARILRPLLMQEKERLCAMLRRLGIPWREDGSNAGMAYRRNRMRNAVLPLLLAENPNFYACVRNLWRMARDSEEGEEPCGVIQVRGEGLFIADADLSRLGRAQRLALLARAVRRCGRGQARADTLRALDRAWEARRFPRRFAFGGGLCAYLDGSGALFQAGGAAERK